MTTELWMMHSKDPSVVSISLLCFPYPEKQSKNKTKRTIPIFPRHGIPKEEAPPTEILES